MAKCKPDEILAPVGGRLACVKRPTVPQKWIDIIGDLLGTISDPIGGGRRALKTGAVYLIVGVFVYKLIDHSAKRITGR
jgi:hypothetical protein